MYGKNSKLYILPFVLSENKRVRINLYCLGIYIMLATVHILTEFGWSRSLTLGLITIPRKLTRSTKKAHGLSFSHVIAIIL